jgi:uncharacterized Fe-S center protein
VGRRGNGLSHLAAAAENGYSLFSTGCENIIADGIRGADDVDVPVKGGKYFKIARIGRATMDADIVVSLSHFKGHELTGFGGTIKNLGMGSGSRAGKMAMHNDGKPLVAADLCIGCTICTRFCAHGAIVFNDGKAFIDQKKCAGCGRCISACSKNAIGNETGCSNEALNCKIAEYVKAVLDGRPHFHINVVNQVSPYCDCHSNNDTAVVPDIGIFAGFDPVALDKACIDAVNAAPVLHGSILSGSRKRGPAANSGSADHFTTIHPSTDWRSQIAHAEKIGLGSGKYELFTVK